MRGPTHSPLLGAVKASATLITALLPNSLPARETLSFLLPALSKHVCWADHHEYSPRSGQHHSSLVLDFSDSRQPPPTPAHLPRVNPEGLAQWDRLDVIHRHPRGGGRLLAQLVELAHCVVENCGDDPAVAMTGRSAVPLAQPELAAIPSARSVDREPQVHAVRIIGATGEAIVRFGGHFLPGNCFHPENCTRRSTNFLAFGHVRNPGSASSNLIVNAL